MNEKLRKIISHYGINKQLKYFQSEVFELNEAIIKRRNTGTRKTLSKVSLFGKFIEKPPLPLSRNPMYH